MPDLTRTKLQNLLGIRPDIADHATKPSVDVTHQRVYDGMIETGLAIGTEKHPALCLAPAAAAQRSGVGVLYCHAHGHRYDIGKNEIIAGRPALLSPPLGIALAKAGATVLCADMPGFGDRQILGSESALSKAALWKGSTLIGQMLADLRVAYAVLIDQPGVHRGSTATIGFSMGGTLAYFLAALEPAIAGCAHLCVFANMGAMIADGDHDLHGPYMTVPGLLAGHDLGDVASLVAPRQQLICTAAEDPLTKDGAYQEALRCVRQKYLSTGYEANLSIYRAVDTGHQETLKMREHVLSFISSLPDSHG